MTAEQIEGRPMIRAAIRGKCLPISPLDLPALLNYSSSFKPLIAFITTKIVAKIAMIILNMTTTLALGLAA